MSKSNYEKDGKIGVISVMNNAVIVERKNKRTIVMKQKIQQGEKEEGMILILKSLVENEEDLKKTSCHEEIVKGKIRTTVIGLAPSGALSIYAALGTFLKTQGHLEEFEVEPEPQPEK